MESPKGGICCQVKPVGIRVTNTLRMCQAPGLVSNGEVQERRKSWKLKLNVQIFAPPHESRLIDSLAAGKSVKLPLSAECRLIQGWDWFAVGTTNETRVLSAPHFTFPPPAASQFTHHLTSDWITGYPSVGPERSPAIRTIWNSCEMAQWAKVEHIKKTKIYLYFKEIFFVMLLFKIKYYTGL